MEGLPKEAGWYWIEYNYFPGKKTIIQVVRQTGTGLTVRRTDDRTGVASFVPVDELDVKWIEMVKSLS